VAGRLQQDLRTGDRVVRIGGDEFAVLLSEVADVAEARAVAERLLNIVDHPFTVGGTRLTISASIGVAVGTAHETVEQLLARSDAAMYEAKHAGRATVRVSDATG
jgi:diguanylate cyclase (GGDEF)-like protein